jgi:hypothetical protein
MWSQLQLWGKWTPPKLFAACHLPVKPRVLALQFRYDKAGLSVCNEPIPWNAEAVRIEALVRGPAQACGQREDYYLRVPGYPRLAADTLRPGALGVAAASFRLPPVRELTPVELCCQSQVLDQLTLPYLSAEQFLSNLRLEAPTLFAQLGAYQVPCQVLVASQCRGLTACGLLTSPTSLLPLADLGGAVEFLDQRTGQSQTVALRLSGPQLLARQAMLSATPPDWPEQTGTYTVRWTIADRVLGACSLRTVSPQAFQQSLRLIDGRYVYDEGKQCVAFSPYLPVRESLCRLGLCFRVASREPGIAGLCRLTVRARRHGCPGVQDLAEQELVVTDGPTLFLPATMPAQEFQQIAAYELLGDGRPLGVLSGSPRPVATFTNEGGFRGPVDFDWTGVSEQELADGLRRLMAVPSDGVPQDASVFA